MTFSYPTTNWPPVHLSTSRALPVNNISQPWQAGILPLAVANLIVILRAAGSLDENGPEKKVSPKKMLHGWNAKWIRATSASMIEIPEHYHLHALSFVFFHLTTKHFHHFHSGKNGEQKTKRPGSCPTHRSEALHCHLWPPWRHAFESEWNSSWAFP